MKALQTLPENYKEIFSVNLQRDKKTAVFINASCLVIALVLALPMNFYIPFATLFNMRDGLLTYTIRLAVLIILMIAYMVLHELVHGLAMKRCGTKKVKYGFTGLYAFAGSDDYYDKRSYIMIALAPIVVWGIVIAVINAAVPKDWFWVVYLLQIVNISGAAGDFYVSVRFSRLSGDILVRDSGLEMTVFSKQ